MIYKPFLFKDIKKKLGKGQGNDQKTKEKIFQTSMSHRPLRTAKFWEPLYLPHLVLLTRKMQYGCVCVCVCEDVCVCVCAKPS